MMTSFECSVSTLSTFKIDVAFRLGFSETYERELDILRYMNLLFKHCSKLEFL